MWELAYNIFMVRFSCGVGPPLALKCDVRSYFSATVIKQQYHLICTENKQK